MLLLLVLAFVFGFIGSMPLMGPIAVLVVSRCAERKYGEALRLGLGGGAAEGFYASIAFFGFATFFADHPLILPISRGVTAVVLVLLGIHFAQWKPDDPKTTEDEKHPASAFFFGFSITAVNPTLLATWSAVTAALYAHQIVHMRWWMCFPFGASAAIGVACWFSLFVALLRRYRDHFDRHLLGKVVRGMGMLLVAIGLYTGFALVRAFFRPAS
jgi:threonine/homoserine/homoserine lactone efflux protein